MIPGIRQLITPLDYLRIKQGVKLWYDFYIPAGVTALTVTLIWFLPGSVNVFGSQGLISHITQLLQMLIGFYIAALAAIATFPSPILDQGIDGDPVKLRKR